MTNSLETFINYLITEYKDKITNYAALETKFSHTSNVKIGKNSRLKIGFEQSSNIPPNRSSASSISSPLKNDKQSLTQLRCDLIKVNIAFFDKSMNKLFSTAITFENNLLNKAQSKKLINISPKELENKFMVAKNEICEIILNEYLEKRKDLNEKINEITKYKGVKGIIPDAFKGESINIAYGCITDVGDGAMLQNEAIAEKTKSRFDM